MIKKVYGDEALLEVSSCSSGNQDLTDSDDETETFEDKKSKFDLKEFTDKFFIKRESMIFEKKGDIAQIYTMEKELGTGAFGTVILAKHKIMGSKRAVKIVPKSKIMN
jgi:hypothetical protein